MYSVARTTLFACLIGTSVAVTATSASAGMMPSNLAALKSIDTGNVLDVHYRYRGWGGAAIAAGIIGGAVIASRAYSYPYYGGYYGYGYPAYYGYAPAYYAYPAYSYPAYAYRPYGYYYGGYYPRRAYYGYAPYRRVYWRSYHRRW